LILQIGIFPPKLAPEFFSFENFFSLGCHIDFCQIVFAEVQKISALASKGWIRSLELSLGRRAFDFGLMGKFYFSAGKANIEIEI
jgi:hypothetical protein